MKGGMADGLDMAAEGELLRDKHARIREMLEERRKGGSRERHVCEKLKRGGGELANREKERKMNRIISIRQ